MAFTFTQNISDNDEKWVRTAGKLAAPNGVTPRTANQRLKDAVDAFILADKETVRLANKERRSAAILAASAAQVNSINSTLGVVNLEDEP